MLSHAGIKFDYAAGLSNAIQIFAKFKRKNVSFFSRAKIRNRYAKHFVFPSIISRYLRIPELLREILKPVGSAKLQ